MKYKEFEQAVDSMQLCTKVSHFELKKRYRELSKVYHPDMPNADADKFDEITKAYKLLLSYMQEYRFSLSQEEFKEQYPSVLNTSQL